MVQPVHPVTDGKPQLRVVILDHPKAVLHKENVKRLLADSVGARQMSFHRTIDTYITMDKYDMIGTHFLLFDVSDLYSPKVLSGIKVVYKDRCEKYGLGLPLDENILKASLPTQEFYRAFRSSKSNLPECVGWFVDSDFSYAKSQLDLAQILFFSITTFLLRQKITYFSGATNERYKASRWVAKVGHFEDGHVFDHSTIPYPHKVTLVEHFHTDWLKQCFTSYRSLLDARYEIVPDDSKLLSLEEIERQVELASYTKSLLKAS